MIINSKTTTQSKSFFRFILIALISLSTNSFAESYKCLLAGTTLNEKPFLEASIEQWGSLDLNGNIATFLNGISKSTEKLNYIETINDKDSSRLVYGKSEFGISTAINFVKYKDPNKTYWLQYGATRNDKTLKQYYNCGKN